MRIVRCILILLVPNALLLAQQAQVRVLSVESVQAIQDSKQPVELIAKKSTVIRVYMVANVPQGGVPLVGDLKIIENGQEKGTVHAYRSVVPPTSSGANQQQMRENIDSSLNFIVPPNLTTAGDKEIYVTNVRTDGSPNTALTCDGCSTAVKLHFVGTAPLRVRLVGIRYKTQSSGTQTAHAPRAVDFELITSWLNRVYPSSGARITSCLADTDEPWPFDCTIANSIVSNVRARELGYTGAVATEQDGTVPACGQPPISTAELARTHYYGVVFDGGGFMRGCASTVPDGTDFQAVASGPTGDPSRWENFLWDDDQSYGDWYAGHEIGHLMGRQHPGKCGSTADDDNYPFDDGRISGADGSSVGVDVGYPLRKIPMQALPGTKWSDTMDYCDHVWQSAYTYEAIATRLSDEGKPSAAGPGPGGPQDVSSQVTKAEVLNVIAVVSLKPHKGKIKYVNRLPQGILSPPAKNGAAVIRVLDTDNHVLQDIPVDIRLNTPADPDRSGLINATFPFNKNTSEIQLLLGTKVLDHRKIGPAQPLITDLTVHFTLDQDSQLGPPSMQSSQINFSWKASDPDKDRLFYDVEMSRDQGATWSPIATDLRKNTHSVNSTLLAPNEIALFRVKASDGLKTAVSQPQQLTMVKISQDLLTHVEWAIFHEGCDVFGPRAGSHNGHDILKPIPQLRACYINKEQHNAAAANLIAQASDAELQVVTTKAAQEIPEKYELFVNFDWVARHEQQLSTFRQLLAEGNFARIRDIYSKLQAHNPNTTHLLSAVDDATIRSMISAIRDVDPKKRPRLKAIE
jgi:hypothetical protein